MLFKPGFSQVVYLLQGLNENIYKAEETYKQFTGLSVRRNIVLCITNEFWSHQNMWR